MPADSPNHNLYVFMLAASWPDLARSREGETGDSHTTWHYYGAPVTPDGKRVPTPSTPRMTAGSTNAIEALTFELNILILDDKDVPFDDRAIITIAPNALMSVIHDCMPVILKPDEYDTWLDPSTPSADAQELLQPHPDGELIAEPASRYVSSPKHEVPECIAPIEQ